MNKEKLKAVAERIVERPEAYYQNNWFRHTLNDGSCGTAACIAGHVCLMDNRVIFNSAGVMEGMVPGTPDVADYAQQALDLTPLEAARLFSSASCWPEPFRSAYRQARDAKNWQEAACVAAARIRHFCATDGRE